MPDDHALHVLTGVLARLRSHSWEREHWDPSLIRADREDALAKFGIILSPEQVVGIEKETFLGFLRNENKRHRMGLGLGFAMTADMPRLGGALAVLVDERLPLGSRLDRLRPQGGKPLVFGLGPSIITTTLHFADPDRYGIMNGASERVMRRLGLAPELSLPACFSERYEEFNRVLLRTAAAVGVDLGLLDSLWWRVQPQDFAGFDVPGAKGRRSAGRREPAPQLSSGNGRSAPLETPRAPG